MASPPCAARAGLELREPGGAHRGPGARHRAGPEAPDRARADRQHVRLQRTLTWRLLPGPEAGVPPRRALEALLEVLGHLLRRRPVGQAGVGLPDLGLDRPGPSVLYGQDGLEVVDRADPVPRRVVATTLHRALQRRQLTASRRVRARGRFPRVAFAGLIAGGLDQVYRRL